MAWFWSGFALFLAKTKSYSDSRWSTDKWHLLNWLDLWKITGLAEGFKITWQLSESGHVMLFLELYILKGWVVSNRISFLTDRPFSHAGSNLFLNHLNYLCTTPAGQYSADVRVTCGVLLKKIHQIDSAVLVSDFLSCGVPVAKHQNRLSAYLRRSRVDR